MVEFLELDKPLRTEHLNYFKKINETELPSSGQPSERCGWYPSDDGQFIHWDDFEDKDLVIQVEWLKYLIDNFFEPWGYVLNGRFEWSNYSLSKPFDLGTDLGFVYVWNNKVEIHHFIHVRSDSSSPRRLRVFLCHSSEDKDFVRKLYSKLSDSGVDAWFDEKSLLPGQDWQYEISKAVRNADLVIVCLSRCSVNKIGYVQKEIKYALDIADMQPEGSIFIVPLKIEECVIPERLRQWQWLNFFEKDGHERLLYALEARASTLSEQ